MEEEDYAAYLEREARSGLAAIHQFRILRDENGESVHLFFEGDDDFLFYIPEVRRRLNNVDLHFYNCGGKAGVVESHDEIRDSGVDMNGCLFFVDRDYDDYLGCQPNVSDRVYVTDGYSIESYIACDSIAKVIFEEIVKLSKADPEFSSVASFTRNAMESFYCEVKPLTAWILAAKEAGLRPNLQNTVGLKRVLFLGADGKAHRCPEGFTYLRKQLIGEKNGPSFSSVRTWLRKLEYRERKLWTRGKYDLWFFHLAVIQAVDLSSARKKAAGGRTNRITQSLRSGDFFELLGGRIKMPRSLLDFLDVHLPAV